MVYGSRRPRCVLYFIKVRGVRVISDKAAAAAPAAAVGAGGAALTAAGAAAQQLRAEPLLGRTTRW